MYAFLVLRLNVGKSFILNRFRMENLSIWTMYSILQRKENNLRTERKVGSGRIVKKMPIKQVKPLEKSIDPRDGIS